MKAKEIIEEPVVETELKIKQDKINYHIDNNSLGEGTPKEKVRRNIEAIKLLRELEDDKRLANQEEQEILSQYVGWGGLPDVFDENPVSVVIRSSRNHITKSMYIKYWIKFHLRKILGDKAYELLKKI